MEHVWENLIDDKELHNPISDQLTKPVLANDSILQVYGNTTSTQLGQNYVRGVNNTPMEWLNDSLLASILNPDIVHADADSQISSLVAEPHTDEETALPHEVKVEVCVNQEQSVKSTSHFDHYIEDLFAVLENHTPKGDDANPKVWNRPTLMQDHNLEDSLQQPSDDALVSRVFNSESPGVKKSEQARTVPIPIIVQSSPCFNKESCRKRANNDNKAFFDVNACGKSPKQRAVAVPCVQMSSSVLAPRRSFSSSISNVLRPGQTSHTASTSRKVNSNLTHGCQQLAPIASSTTRSIGPPNSISATSQSHQGQLQRTSTIQIMQSLDQIPGELTSNATSCGSRHQDTTNTATFTHVDRPTMNQQPSGGLARNEITLQQVFPATVPESAGRQRKAVNVATTSGYGGSQRPRTLAAAAEALSSPQQPAHQSVDQTFYQSVLLNFADQSLDHAVSQTCQLSNVYQGVSQTSQPLPASQCLKIDTYQANHLPNAYHQSVGQALYQTNQIVAGQIDGQTVHQPSHVNQVAGEGLASQTNQLRSSYENVGNTASQAYQLACGYPGVGQTTYQTVEQLPGGRTVSLIDQPPRYESTYGSVGHNPYHAVQRLPVGQSVGQTSAQTNQTTSAYNVIGQPNQLQIVQLFPVGQTSAQTSQTTSAYKRIGQPQIVQLLPVGQTASQTNQTTLSHQRVCQSNLLPNASLNILPATALRPNVHFAQTAPVDPIALGLTSSSIDMRSRKQARILPATLEIEARVQSFRRYPSVFLLVPNCRMITQLANCGFSLILENMIQCVDRRCLMKHLLPNVFNKDSISVTWHTNECRFHSASRPCKYCISLSGLQTECPRCSQTAHRTF